MYSNWTYDDTTKVARRSKEANDAAKQETRRRTMALELVSTVVAMVRDLVPRLSASELRSMMFRHRGVSVDSFTRDIVGLWNGGVDELVSFCWK